MKKNFIAIALTVIGFTTAQAQFSVKYDPEIQPTKTALTIYTGCSMKGITLRWTVWADTSGVSVQVPT